MNNQNVPFIVGIGASAGGLEALTALLHDVEPREDCAFVVVQHLSPDYRSMIVELLGNQTKMNVQRAVNNEPVQGARTYVIEPQTTLTISGGRLIVKPQEPGTRSSSPIDVFFKSLAEDQGCNAAAVVLSGTGSDGMRGCRIVKELGGLVVAQNAESAAFDGMPRNVRTAGLADLVLPPNQVPGEIGKLLDRGGLSNDILDEDSRSVVINRLLGVLRRDVSIDFGHYKPSAVVRRVQRRLGVLGLTPEQYADRFEADAGERALLARDMLIGVTRFFRDAEAFTLLTAQLKTYVQETEEPLRIWIAGCSTGEEAYSVAIALSETLRELDPSRGFKLFATDVNAESLKTASSGQYSASDVTDIPPELLSRYFERDSSEGFTVVQELRDRMLFSRHNVFQDPPFSGLDVVVCRNLLIYLRAAVQKRVCQNFAFALKTSGLLLLGPSESPPTDNGDFDLIDARWQLYRSRGRRDRSPQVGGPIATPQKVRPNAIAAAPRKDVELLEVYRTLLGTYAPAFVVTDTDFQLVFRSGALGSVLRVPEGKATQDLRRMLPEQFESLFLTIGRKVTEDHHLRFENLMLDGNGMTYEFALSVHYVTESALGRALYLLVFEGISERPQEPTFVALDDSERDSQQRIRQLEELLANSKENLEATVEELESSNEQLRTTNEELLASNEELQSLNEELQSVNEELHTVNAEHQTKIEELSRLNSDMDQLLSSIDIGALFLDDQLQIRRFNAPVAHFINMLEQDTGRPLSHLSHEFGDAPLAELCGKAQQSNRALERLLVSSDGARVLFRARALPKDAPEGGLVLTFTDVTSVHTERESRRLLDEALQCADVPIALMDLEGRITLANKAFAATFDRDSKWLTGLDSTQLLSEEERVAFAQRVSDTAKGDNWYGLMHSQRADGTLFQEAVRLAPLRNEQGSPIGVLRLTERIFDLGTIEDATITGTYTWDIRTDETLCSTSLYDVLGLDRNTPPPTMKTVYPLIVEEDRKNVDRNLAAALDSKEPYEFSFRTLRATGEMQKIGSRMLPDRLPTGELRRIIGVMWVVHEAAQRSTGASATR